MRAGMSLTLYTIKAGMATVVSLGMALLGCLVGCMQPAGSSFDKSLDAPTSWNTSADTGQSMPMAEAETCRSSEGNSSVPPGDRKPFSNGSLSCCPLEVTVIRNWDIAKLQIVPPREFAPAPNFSFILSRSFGPAESVPPVSHTGRDTLLVTRLLRI